jgi:hypothetical protein
MKYEFKTKVGARFKAIIYKAETHEKVRESDWFNNLVLDSGLARMSAGRWIDRCAVGTSNIPPIASQTALQSKIAETTTVQSETSGVISSTPVYYYVTRTWRFAVGAATGNISEVGLGWSTNALWNRALIKDINGNPTTITVLADEYLDVISEVRFYMTESFSGTFGLYDKNLNLLGNYSYIGKPSLVNPTSVGFEGIYLGDTLGRGVVYSGSIGASVNTMPSGTSALTNNAAVTNSYNGNTCTGKVKFDTDIANAFTHKSLRLTIGGLGLLNGVGYQVEITPGITKNSAESIEYEFTLSWDRYTP